MPPISPSFDIRDTIGKFFVPLSVEKKIKIGNLFVCQKFPSFNPSFPTLNIGSINKVVTITTTTMWTKMEAMPTILAGIKLKKDHPKRYGGMIKIALFLPKHFLNSRSRNENFLDMNLFTPHLPKTLGCLNEIVKLNQIDKVRQIGKNSTKVNLV